MGYISDESRFRDIDTEVDSAGRLVFLEREPYRYKVREDNIFHTAAQGDTWWSIAERYYADISPRGCGLFWIVCEYQPTPVVDPTLTLQPGSVVVVPSPLLVVTDILRGSRQVYL